VKIKVNIGGCLRWCGGAGCIYSGDYLKDKPVNMYCLKYAKIPIIIRNNEVYADVAEVESEI
jgi:hypothetical protein